LNKSNRESASVNNNTWHGNETNIHKQHIQQPARVLGLDQSRAERVDLAVQALRFSPYRQH
jgi:hypothetical protein